MVLYNCHFTVPLYSAQFLGGKKEKRMEANTVQLCSNMKKKTNKLACNLMVFTDMYLIEIFFLNPFISE